MKTKLNVVRDALNFKYGHKSYIAVSSALCNRLAFSLGFNVLRPETEVAFDEATATFYGIDGIKPTRVSDDTTAGAFVAAQFLLVDGINKPDPEQGGVKNLWAQKYFRTPSMIVTNVTDWDVKQRTQRLEANAEALNELTKKPLNIEARRASIKAEVLEQAKDAVNIVDGLLKRAMIAHKGMTSEIAVEMVIDTLAALNADAGKVVTDAIQRMVDALAERISRGQFAQIDSGVYALAKDLGIGAKAEPKVTVVPPNAAPSKP